VQIERLKWIQPADLTTDGIDVNASLDNQPPYILADDFKCNTTTPISDIHVWGSWRYDLLPKDATGGPDPTQVVFFLSVHEDIPAGQGGPRTAGPARCSTDGHSSPGVQGLAVPDDINEGWLDPPERYNVQGDHVCWQYDFEVPREEWFWQRGTPEKPIIYWLDVQAQPLNEPNARFGWKTSTRHWNDDAVWGNGQEPFLGPGMSFATHPATRRSANP